MQKITILCVGKIKESYLTAGISEYVKRLSGYCTLRIVEVQDERIPDPLSEAQERIVKDKEGEKILAKLPENAYCIALDLRGKMRNSVAFAEHLEDLASSGKSHLVFLIGGSLGLSEKVLQHTQEMISFSPMTFPHQLMRLVFLEQLYRAFRIRSGQPYHK